MMQLPVSFLCYLLTAAAHVCVHRVLALGFGKITRHTVWIFVPGAIVTLWLLMAVVPGQIPISALFFYLLASGAHLLFFWSFFFDARSPSAKLLFLVRRRGPITRELLLTHFSDAETVTSRLNTLISQGYLVARGGRLYAADKAVPIARFIAWYRRLMKWERGG